MENRTQVIKFEMDMVNGPSVSVRVCKVLENLFILEWYSKGGNEWYTFDYFENVPLYKSKYSGESCEEVLINFIQNKIKQNNELDIKYSELKNSVRNNVKKLYEMVVK